MFDLRKSHRRTRIYENQIKSVSTICHQKQWVRQQLISFFFLKFKDLKKFKMFKFYSEIPEFVIRNRTRYATVTILPEIELCHPVYGHDSNSLSKFRKSEEFKSKLLKYESKSQTWPDFVYKMYDVSIACEKIKKFLLTLKIGMNFRL